MAGRTRARGCLKVVAVGAAVLIFGPGLIRGCSNLLASSGPGNQTRTAGTPGSAAPTSQSPCPKRVADELPAGDGASLVKAYRAGAKQITLCLTVKQQLYYYGEFVDRSDTGVAMPATRTAEGFTARNGEYRYEITGSTVTIELNGRRISQEALTALPSPS